MQIPEVNRPSIGGISPAGNEEKGVADPFSNDWLAVQFEVTCSFRPDWNAGFLKTGAESIPL
jgi:hypothetical protein